MESGYKPKSYEEIHQEHLKKEADKQERMDRILKETIERLKTDPDIQKYLSQFSSTSTESFITGYAHKLMMTLEYGDMYVKMHEEHSTEYMERAEKCLGDIQLKKLFDLRCQWGANLVKCEGIEASIDFDRESEDIMNCHLVLPITKEEFDLYMKYARSAKFVFTNDCVDLNTLSELRERANKENDNDIDDDEDDDEMDDEVMFPWFEYHNTHTGSDVYMTLPDLRGEKESFYQGLYFDEQNAELKVKQERGEVQQHVPDPRPRISDYHYADILQFMKKFEKPETVRLFESSVELGTFGIIKESEEANDDDWLDEQVESIIHNLGLLPDVKLPVKANADWRKALIAAWEKFEKTQTINALPAAYDNYLFMLESKIAFEGKKDRYGNSSDGIKRQIIKGRQLNGEPADFNF